MNSYVPFGPSCPLIMVINSNDCVIKFVFLRNLFLQMLSNIFFRLCLDVCSCPMPCYGYARASNDIACRQCPGCRLKGNNWWNNKAQTLWFMSYGNVCPLQENHQEMLRHNLGYESNEGPMQDQKDNHGPKETYFRVSKDKRLKLLLLLFKFHRPK